MRRSNRDRGRASTPPALPRAPLDRARAALTYTLVVFGMLVSGGPGLFFNLVLEALALALLAVMIVQGPARTVPLPMRVLIGVVVAIPLVQLVPLPFGWWTGLPGRELAAAVEQAASLPPAAHAISLDPDATRRSALALLPGLAVYFSAARAAARERVALAGIVLVLASLSALLGVFQFAAGSAYLYDSAHTATGWATGLFNNRNQAADLILSGIALAAGLGRWKLPRERRALAAGALPVLALCCVATGSRMGMAMLPFVLAASLAVLFVRDGGSGRAWPWLVGAAAVALAVAAAPFVPALQPVFERFHGGDTRVSFWEGALAATKQYFPVGSGVGSFVAVYPTVEDLDLVAPNYVNHAHNEYIEIALETGLVGLLAVLGYLVILARSAWSAFRTRDWPLRAAGLVVVLVMLAHSAVEYPLRNYVLLIVWALANGWVTTAPGDATDGGEKKAVPFTWISR